MEGLLKTWFVLSIAHIFFTFVISFDRSQTGIDDYVNYCDEKNIKIQLTYVLDCTYGFSDYMTDIAWVAYKFPANITSKYAVVEQAFVCFGDYLEEDEPKPRAEKPELGDCYRLKHYMSTNSTSVYRTMISARTSVHGGTNAVESSLTALLFAAADKRLGWANGTYETKDGITRKVHKFIVLGTDEASTISLGKPGPRKNATGDGSDKCSTTLPPYPTLVEKILTEKNISVVGIYGTGGVTDPVTFFRNYFSKLQVPYGQDYLVRDANYKKFNEGWIRQAILYSMERALNAECEESDPEPYNTLGL